MTTAEKTEVKKRPAASGGGHSARPLKQSRVPGRDHPGAVSGKVMEPVGQVAKFLAKFTDKSLTFELKEGTVITVPDDFTMEEAYARLQENGIHAAPVVASKSNKCVGVIDVLDILAGALSALESVRAQDLRNEDSDELMLSEEMLSLASTHYIKGIAHRKNPFHPVRPGTTLLDIAVLMNRENVCWVPIVEDDGSVSSIVTQTALLTHLCDYIDQVPRSIRQTKIKDIETSDEVTVLETVPVLDCFRTMQQRGVSTVGVVDKLGHLVENISVSDLKLWSEWSFNGITMRFRNLANLGQTTGAFLMEVRKSQQQKVKEYTPGEAVCCVETDTVEDVMVKMVEGGIHSIHIVKQGPSGERTPVRMVTLTDILHAVIV